MKNFDYKLVLILVLFAVMFYFYKEIDGLNNSVSSLNTDNENINKKINLLKDNKPEITNNEENMIINPIETIDTVQSLQNFDNIQHFNLNDVQNVETKMDNFANKINEDNTDEEYVADSYTDDILKLNVDSIENLENNNQEIEQNDKVIEIDTIEEQNKDKILDDNGSETLEEFSNEDVNIYSNDNEDDEPTSIENIKEVCNSNVDELLKNKLAELQDMARSMEIEISREGSSKKKTKLQLAQEISEKKISKLNIYE